uniref:Uncharacterized protein n=1 Tax=Parascaris equorum TaxID=6256 RepID=A0A914RAX0_PAREQ
MRHFYSDNFVCVETTLCVTVNAFFRQNVIHLANCESTRIHIKGQHALPPGYILKKDRKTLEEQKRLNEISLEELIEKEATAPFSLLSGKHRSLPFHRFCLLPY